MRKLLVAVIMGLTLSFAGCNSSLSVHKGDPVEIVKENPAKAAQNAVDQAYATIIAAANTVGKYYDSQLITKEEAIKYQLKLEEAVGYVNEAQAFLKAGNVQSANLKLELYKIGIEYVQREIVRLKNKETN